jgi:hypothetical protein
LRAEAGGAAPRPAAVKSSSASAPAAARASAPGRPAAPAAAEAHRPPAADGELGALWSKLLETVGRASPFVRSYFSEAHPVSFAKNVLTIGFDPEFADHISFIDNAKNHELLQTKLSELGHPNAQVKFVQSSAAPVSPSAPAAPAAPAPAPAAAASAVERPKAVPEPPRTDPPPVSSGKDDFKNDPLIQKALEVFKGQIVEVRS